MLPSLSSWGNDVIGGVHLDFGSISLGGEEVDVSSLVGASSAMFALLLSSQLLVPRQLVSSSTLDQIVEGTFLDKKNLQCVYKGSRDGWSATNFHEMVDGRGSAVVVCRTLTGKVFGGFNPNGWRSTDDYYDSNSAFLWANSGSSVIKFPVLTGGNAAIFDYATGGPCFGSADMLIGPPKAAIMGGFAGPDMENTALNAGDLRQTKVSPGMAYRIDRKWPVFGSPRLLEVEVYCNAAVGQQKASW